MTKKNEKLDLESDSIVDMNPMMIHQQAEFLDKLIELIPARFYLPDDDNTEKKWFPGLSKAEKAMAKRETVENLKKAKRDRLDPEKSSLTTLDLQKQKLEKEKSDNDETDMFKPMIVGLQEDDTYEKLRQRFQRKRDSCSEVEKLNVVEEAVKDLTYGYVKIGDEDDEEYGKNRKRKRVSKAKELEMVMKLEALKKDPEKGDFVAKKHSWQAAISRASGTKVHDDSKLLKKRIRKEKKRREKNAEKWKERIEGQEKVKVEKQQKRSENITNRIQEKKMRRIAKREKKLLSPGALKLARGRQIH